MENEANIVISEFTVEGMHCPKCEEKIVLGIERIPGIESVKVDREGKTVVVTHAAESGLTENIHGEIGRIQDGKFTVTGVVSRDARG